MSLTLVTGARPRAANDGGTDQAEYRLRVAERFLAEARVIGGGPARGGG